MLYYFIGLPGSGKSTLMKSLMNTISKDWKQERVCELLDTHYCEANGKKWRVLGKYEEGEIFCGTDRLSMAVAPKAIEWAKIASDDIILGEGDRLNNKSFFEAFKDDLCIVYLEVGDEEREFRYKERGSNQPKKFIQTVKTKCENIINEFGDKQTLFGFEKGKVIKLKHETLNDTKKIIDYIRGKSESELAK